MTENPIRRFCKEKKITYEQFARTVRETHGTKGPGQIQVAGYACGSRKMGKEMADRIHKTFPELNREEMLYWTKIYIPREES